MRRFALIFALLFLAMSGSASALTVEGATDEQQATVTATVQSCLFDYRVVDAYFGNVTVRFISLKGPMATSWNDGSIDIRSDLTGDYLAMVTAHEWSHHIYRMMPPQFYALWETWCGPARDYRTWTHNPREAFAETARVALFPQSSAAPTTMLEADEDDVHRLMYWWQTTSRSPFTDLGREDMELQVAAALLAQEGVIEGYEDKTFRPYEKLSRRHVALICERSGLFAPSWTDDYRPATRGDVAAQLPGLTWLEERWDEDITRSQLVRLIGRAS